MTERGDPFRTGKGVGDPNHTTAHAETLVLCIQYSLHDALVFDFHFQPFDSLNNLSIPKTISFYTYVKMCIVNLLLI
jgi:hypothetical protein